jgi:hypothetical protein
MIIRKLLNILFILIVSAAIILLAMCIPLVRGVLTCYDKSILSFDEVEVSSRSYGWSRQRVCEIKKDSINNLVECVSTEQNKSPLPRNIQQKVIDLLPSVRPNSENVEFRKIQHDTECAEFPEFQFYPSY